MASKTLPSLLLQCKSVCETIAPLVQSIYRYNLDKSSSVSTTKADSSAFTIADGLVQHFLTSFLDQTKFADIVGEENVQVNIQNLPYHVDNLSIPNEFTQTIQNVKDHIKSNPLSLDSTMTGKLSVFIDPIDGTLEFVTGLGDQCTILVGFTDSATNRSVAGLIFSPLTLNYALGCEGHFETNLYPIDSISPKDRFFLTTNGKISPFVESLIEELGSLCVKQGGVGNKVLKLIQYSLTCDHVYYIQDRGVSRWDSCAPEAVIHAFKGSFTRLDKICEGVMEKYTYTVNSSDMCREMKIPARFTKYNVKQNRKSLVGSIVTSDNVEALKPYSNVCGLFCAKVLDLDSLILSVKKVHAKTSMELD